MASGSSRDDCVFNPTGAPPNFRTRRPDSQIYRFQQMISYGTLSTNTVTETQLSSYFGLSALNQAGTFTALFDQYRITKVEYWISPRTTAVTTASANPGRLVSVVDYDDANALTSIAEAMEYQNALVSSGVDGHYRCFRPHAALAAYTGAFTGYQNTASPWIDAASPSVQHYGVKVIVSPTDAVYTYDITVRLTCEFRNAR